MNVVDYKIGVEMHVKLNKFKKRLFCNCNQNSTDNCEICLSLPGAMPIFQKEI